jgi:hypothetical protein
MPQAGAICSRSISVSLPNGCLVGKCRITEKADLEGKACFLFHHFHHTLLPFAGFVHDRIHVAKKGDKNEH